MAQIVGNLDFVKKVPGILKLCELGLGIICLALSANYSVLPNVNIHMASRSECFFLVTSIMFFTTTLLIIVSSLLSDTTETRLRQSLFEPLYHGLAFILYFSGSVALLADDYHVSIGGRPRKDGFLAAGSIGLINSILYALSTYDAYKAYVNE